MAHLQAITDSGKEVEEEKPFKNNYKIETEPIEWEHSSIQDHFNFISEISRGNNNNNNNSRIRPKFNLFYFLLKFTNLSLK